MRVWFDSAYAGFDPLLPRGHQYPSARPGFWEELLSNPEVSVLMAEEDGELLGYTSCGESRDDDATPEVGEVRNMFVGPNSWRRGVGRALIEAAIEDMRRRGYSEATVWSFASNDRANAFYEASGFTRDGGERRQEAWADILEFRYRRSL
jgi:ribosomal protein S18 acetylase RimI-like enzyme